MRVYIEDQGAFVKTISNIDTISGEKLKTEYQ